MTATAQAIGPDACSACHVTHEALGAVGRVLYDRDRCGTFVCSDCAASITNDGVACEACTTPDEWRRG